MNLGKLLVKELQIESGSDTLQRWMAHYIAELISKQESEEDEEKKEKINTVCFKTILSLWENRSILPDGSRPFEDFEPIWKLLEKLDNKRPYYSPAESYDSPEPKNEEMLMWLKIADGIDSLSTSLIDLSLRKASTSAIDEKNLEWLRAAHGLSEEVDGIVHIVFSTGMKENQEKTDSQIELERLQNYREKMKALLSVSEGVMKMVDDEIDALTKK